jgi:hypothetical protein
VLCFRQKLIASIAVNLAGLYFAQLESSDGQAVPIPRTADLRNRASYLALVVRERYVTAIATGVVERSVQAEYRFGDDLAKWAFWPLEQIHRKVRPGAWEVNEDGGFVTP